jgi:tryptophan-rich sensory protein
MDGVDLAALLSLLVFLALVLGSGATGGIYRPGAWYAALDKPWWTPPNAAFPIVWGLLYLMVAASGWLVWRAGGWAAWPALLLFAVNLLLGAGWSWLFFGRQRMDLAMADLLLFWASIIALIFLFADWSRAAAWLLVPYAAWVSVAGLLNAALWRRNGARGELASR